MARWYAVHLEYPLKRWDSSLNKGAGGWPVMVELAEAEIEAWLPTLSAKVRRQSGTRVSHWPLYPGYAFARLEPGGEAWGKVQRSEVDGVSGIVTGAGCLWYVGDDEIAAARQAERVEGAVTISVGAASRRKRLELGQLVRVERGTFQGFSGQVSAAGLMNTFDHRSQTGRIIETERLPAVKVSLSLFGHPTDTRILEADLVLV